MSETITDNEATSLEKIAALRGELGRVRGLVAQAVAILDERQFPKKSAVRDVLVEALAVAEEGRV